MFIFILIHIPSYSVHSFLKRITFQLRWCHEGLTKWLDLGSSFPPLRAEGSSSLSRDWPKDLALKMVVTLKTPLPNRRKQGGIPIIFRLVILLEGFGIDVCCNSRLGWIGEVLLSVTIGESSHDVLALQVEEFISQRHSLRWNSSGKMAKCHWNLRGTWEYARDKQSVRYFFGYSLAKSWQETRWVCWHRSGSADAAVFLSSYGTWI